MKSFLVLVSVFLLGSNSFAKSVLYPGVSWQVEVIHGPGTHQYTPYPPTPITEPIVGVGKATVNEYLTRLHLEMEGHVMIYKRICKDAAMSLPIPNVDLSYLSEDLTVWQVNYVDSQSTFDSVIYEQRPEGVLTGPAHALSDFENFSYKRWAQNTLSPISGIPAQPDPEEGPKPDTPKELGIEAVTTKLAIELGLHEGTLKKYVYAKGTEEGALMVRMWLDDKNRLIPADREYDPCDPKTAARMYVFKIIKNYDEGDVYFVRTQLIDVETGVIKKTYDPDFEDITHRLNQEVFNSYDKLGVDVQAPQRD